MICVCCDNIIGYRIGQITSHVHIVLQVCGAQDSSYDATNKLSDSLGSLVTTFVVLFCFCTDIVMVYVCCDNISDY